MNTKEYPQNKLIVPVKGSVLLVLLMILGLFLAEIGLVCQIFYVHKSTQTLDYQQIKTFYVAQSGLAYGKVHFNDLLTMAEPINKTTLYSQINGLPVVSFPDATSKLCVIKTSQYIYSACVCSGKYRAMLRQAYFLTPFRLGKWEKL